MEEYILQDLVRFTVESRYPGPVLGEDSSLNPKNMRVYLLGFYLGNTRQKTRADKKYVTYFEN